MDPINDPGAVINSLQARITQLEAQLRAQQAAHESNVDEHIRNGLRRLRLHGIIPLYVGSDSIEVVEQRVHNSTPPLTKTLNEIWWLTNAPVSQAVKDALSSAANGGMRRW